MWTHHEIYEDENKKMRDSSNDPYCPVCHCHNWHGVRCYERKGEPIEESR
jgi:hypothetical protein